jgi:hypothetical protein
MSLLSRGKVNGAFIFLIIMSLLVQLTLGRETKGASFFDEVEKNTYLKTF